MPLYYSKVTTADLNTILAENNTGKGAKCKVRGKRFELLEM